MEFLESAQVQTLAPAAICSLVGRFARALRIAQVSLSSLLHDGRAIRFPPIRHVLRTRAQVHMGRVTAQGIFTSVVNAQPAIDHAMCEYPCFPAGIHHDPIHGS